MNSRNDIGLFEQAFFDKTLGETLHPGGLELTKHALNLCDLPKSSRIVDVGCGAGVSTEYLKNQYSSVIGIDLSFKLLQAAKNRYSDLTLIQATATHLPFLSNSIDVILVECSLSVFAHTAVILDEFHRILRKNGFLIITDLYAQNPSGLAKLKNMIPSSCLSGSFVKDELDSILNRKGFQISNWEDHSEVIYSHYCKAFHNSSINKACESTDPMSLFLAVAHAKPGYFLCVSRKTSCEIFDYKGVENG